MKKSAVLMICCAVLLAMTMAMPAAAYENVSPTQAYGLVVNGSTDAVAYSPDTTYYLVDVRTAEEWRWVGHPGKNRLNEGQGLDGKVVNVAYMIDWKKQFVVNPSFLSDIDGLFGEVKNQVVLVLICRSGNRSANAAKVLEEAGYRVMNVPAGFSGVTDSRGYRTINGWVIDGLPYNYSSTGAYAD